MARRRAKQQQGCLGSVFSLWGRIAVLMQISRILYGAVREYNTDPTKRKSTTIRR